MFDARMYMFAGLGLMRLAGNAVGDAAMGRLGRTAAGSLWGAVAGGAYGAMSDDTSVLGGALGGAALGGVGSRYIGAGIRRGLLGRRGIGVAAPGMAGAVTGFGKGLYNMARADYRGARMMTNQGYSKIRGLF